jgi:hypothetical protein
MYKVMFGKRELTYGIRLHIKFLQFSGSGKTMAYRDRRETKDKGTGKVVPLHATKGYGEGQVQLQSFLTSALDGTEWSTSLPSCFTPTKRTPDTN